MKTLPFVLLSLLSLETSCADLPPEFPIRPGQQVLIFGDSIVGPGMLSYACNGLLDRSYPGHGITFHSWGKAMANVKSVQPDVEQVLSKRKYDWIFLNFGHNDVRAHSVQEFNSEGVELLRLVRKFHKGKVGWMSLIGNEQTAYPDDPSMSKSVARHAADRKRQAEYVAPVKQICRDHHLTYVPLHETMKDVFSEMSVNGKHLCMTMDHVHPNLLGNWIAAAAILKSLELTVPKPIQIELLQADATADHGRRPVIPLEEPLTIQLASVPLTVRLIPPPVFEVPCRAGTAKTVDGSLVDWKGIASYRIAPPTNVTWELAARCTEGGRYAATMQTSHDSNAMYFAFVVSTPVMVEADWFPEIVELFIDARKDRRRSGNVWRRTKGLTQYAIHRDFTGKVATNATVFVNGDSSQGDRVKVAAKKRADGYVLEMSIPMKNFSQIEVSKGTRLPFNWAVSYTDQSLNLDWLGLMSRSSSTFGYGILRID